MTETTMHEDEFRAVLTSAIDAKADASHGDWSRVVARASVKQRRKTLTRRMSAAAVALAFVAAAVAGVGYLRSSDGATLATKWRPGRATELGATPACSPLPATAVSRDISLTLSRTTLAAGTTTLVDATLTNGGAQSVAFSKASPDRFDTVIAGADGIAVASSELGNLQSTVGTLRAPVEPGGHISVSVLFDARECAVQPPTSSGAPVAPIFGDPLHSGQYEGYVVLPLEQGAVLVGPVSMTVAAG